MNELCESGKFPNIYIHMLTTYFSDDKDIFYGSARHLSRIAATQLITKKKHTVFSFLSSEDYNHFVWEFDSCAKTVNSLYGCIKDCISEDGNMLKHYVYPNTNEEAKEFLVNLLDDFTMCDISGGLTIIFGTPEKSPKDFNVLYILMSLFRDLNALQKTQHVDIILPSGEVLSKHFPSIIEHRLLGLISGIAYTSGMSVKDLLDQQIATNVISIYHKGESYSSFDKLIHQLEEKAPEVVLLARNIYITQEKDNLELGLKANVQENSEEINKE